MPIFKKKEEKTVDMGEEVKEEKKEETKPEPSTTEEVLEEKKEKEERRIELVLLISKAKALNDTIKILRLIEQNIPDVELKSLTVDGAT